MESFPLVLRSLFEYVLEMVDDDEVEPPEKADDSTSVEQNMLDPWLVVLFVSSSISLRVVEKSESGEVEELEDGFVDMPNRRRIASPTQSEHF